MIESPYLGLVPYLEEHAAYFFGREMETRIVAQNLRATRLTILYGESGAGKSSLLRAGVAYQLRAMADSELKRFGNARFLPVVANRWRTDPLAYLIQQVDGALRSATGRDAPAPAPGYGSIEKQLRDCADRYGFAGDLLLIFDQFEEFFQYAHQPALEAAASAFIKQLPELLLRDDIRMRVLLSMREDCLSSLDRFKGAIPRLFDNLLRVKHLTPTQAEEAIVRPLARFKQDTAGASGPVDLDPRDPELAKWVVREIAGAQDQCAETESDEVPAPYLQLVMTRWWETEKTQHSTVLRRTLLRDKLGGVRQIARTHFAETIRALKPAQRRLAARMFDVMVTPSGRKMALSVSELPGADRNLKDIEALVNELYRRRILAALPPPPGGHPDDPCFEFAHDNLARAALEWRRDFERTRALRRKIILVAAVVFVTVAIAITGLLFRAVNADRQLAEAAATRYREAQRILLERQTAPANVPTPEVPSAVQAAPGDVVSGAVEPIAKPAPEAPEGDLPFFMTRSVTQEDLRGKSKWGLEVMRNEIYARYGRTFDRTDLQMYFAAKPWYAPRYAPSQFPTSLLTRVQQANVETILRYEQSMGK